MIDNEIIVSVNSDNNVFSNTPFNLTSVTIEFPQNDLLVIERQLRGALMMLGKLQGKTYKIIDKIEDKK